MIKIISPIYITETYAYISLSKWNLDKEKNDEVEISVFKDDKFVGKGIISRKNWKKTAKHKESKVVFRPEEPMQYYYNNLKFIPEKTKDEELEWMSKNGVFG